MIQHADLFGMKGGGGSFRSSPDNLRSSDSFEVILGLCSGPIKGPTNGVKSVTINGTPIEDATGAPNFKDFILTLADGDPAKFPQIAQMKLGGGSGSIPVGADIKNPSTTTPGAWVPRTLSNTGVDYIDLRFLVSQLFRQDAKGIYAEVATLEIELKPSGSTNWINPLLEASAWTYDPNGSSKGAYVVYMLESQFDPVTGAQLPSDHPGQLRITGKTTSTYVKELRIAVPNEGAYANTSWDLRVRLMEVDTIDDNQNQTRRTLSWESMQAVYATKFGTAEGWRGLAYIQLNGVATDNVNGIPLIEGVYDTKVVRVPPPSVYNPSTRTYTGSLWDGSWAYAFTNDPAWVVSDAIYDTLSGLGAFSYGAHLNKWDALEASKWFSELVPDGAGGYHPRYNLNVVIDQAQTAEETIQYLAGAVGGYAFEGPDGEWRLKVDKPETAVNVFTLESIEGEFVYSHTDGDTWYNDITMVFLNEEFDYREDRIRVFDQAHIDTYGRKPLTLVAVGCTNRQEAYRRGYLRLLSATKEIRNVTFTTNRQGEFLTPFETILVADRDLGYKLPDGILVPNPVDADSTDNRTTGRILTLDVGRTTIGLRDPIRVEAGISYQIVFTAPNPAYNPGATTEPAADWQKPTITITRTLTNSAVQCGDVKTLYLDASLPADIPPNAPFALKATGLPAVPKNYRVLTVEPQDDDERERVRVTAIEIYTPKWTLSDNVDSSPATVQSPSQVVPVPLAPAAGSILAYHQVQSDEGQRSQLTINWMRPSSLFIQGFEVEYTVNGGVALPLASLTRDTTLELISPSAGFYTFSIRSVDRRGQKSLPLTATLEITANMINWSGGISGAGKPADNATVGAPSGTYVGGVLAETLVGDLADAQAAAAAAQSDADTANAVLADIASDSLLTPVEKPTVIKDRDAIVEEQSGIDAQATALGITTEKTTYDNAVSALTTYLATLTTPVLWSTLTGNTTIVGATFRTKFLDVYAARQTLLNKIAEVAATKAAWSGVSGTGKPEDYATRNAPGQALRDTSFDPAEWYLGSAGTATRMTGVATGLPADYAIRITAGAASAVAPQIGAAASKTPVQAGQTVWAGVYVYDSTATATLYLRIYWYGADGVYLGSYASRTLAPGTAQGYYTLSGTAPATAAYALWEIDWTIGTTGYWYISSPYLGLAEQGATVGAPGGTGINGMPVEQLMLGSDVDIVETFSNYPSLTEFQRAWGVSGPAELSFVANSASPGGKMLQIGNNSGNDYGTLGCLRYIPYDAEDPYMVEFDLDPAVVSSGVYYLGLSCIDQNGAETTSGMGTFHYIAASGATLAATRQTLRAYFRGYGTPSVNNNDPANPTPLAAGTVKITPIGLFHYSAAAGQMRVHSIRLRKVEDITTIPTGAWSSTRTYRIAETVEYSNRSFMSRQNNNLNHTPPTTNTSDSWWMLVGGQGAAGANGLNNALVYIYKRSASAPALPTTTGTYTFATGAITGLDNGWTSTVPAGTDPLYVSVATASASTATDTIAAGEWASAVILAQNGDTGAAGLNAATVFLYQRNATGIAPAVPSATTTYTFATGALAGIDNGWSQTVPAEAGGKYLFITTATAVATAATDTIATGEWAAVKKLAQDGADGAPGLSPSASPAAHSVSVDAAGTPKSGQMPKYTLLSLISGTTDVTESASYAIVGTPTNCTASVSNTAGTRGKVTISAMSADSASVEVDCTYGTSTIRVKITLAKAYDGTPGAAASSAGGLANVATWTDTGAIVNMTVGPNGTIQGSNWLTYGFTSTYHQVGLRILYREINTSTWFTLCSDETGGNAIDDVGYAAVSGSVAGPASSKVYEFKLQTYRSPIGTIGTLNARPYLVSWTP